VVPAHSFKFAARLQEMHTGKDPVLIRIQTKAGHGAGKPTSMQIEEWSDVKVDMSSAPAPKKEKGDSAG
jgi:prolyl oligopeptidase